MSEMISIVFFGSGPVAAASLDKLRNSFFIEAIITKPTTKVEMSQASPDTPLYTVSNKAALDKLIESLELNSTVAVLIDFGIIVSKKVIDTFSRGIVNSHFSLLPKLRGADPISFAVLEGHKETGVSLMLLVEAMDEGPLLTHKEITLSGSETTLSLTNSLINISYELLRDSLPKYLNGEISPQKQQGNPSYTRKLTKEDGEINWDKPAAKIEREIRAFAGWPKSYSSFGDIQFTVIKAKVLEKTGKAGKLFITTSKNLGVYCGEDSLEIEILKPAGKKEMSNQAFLAGYKSKIGL